MKVAFIQRTLFSLALRFALRILIAYHHHFAQSLIYNEIRFADNRVEQKTAVVSAES